MSRSLDTNLLLPEAVQNETAGDNLSKEERYETFFVSNDKLECLSLARLAFYLSVSFILNLTKRVYPLQTP